MRYDAKSAARDIFRDAICKRLESVECDEMDDEAQDFACTYDDAPDEYMVEHAAVRRAEADEEAKDRIFAAARRRSKAVVDRIMLELASHTDPDSGGEIDEKLQLRAWQKANDEVRCTVCEVLEEYIAATA